MRTRLPLITVCGAAALAMTACGRSSTQAAGPSVKTSGTGTSFELKGEIIVYPDPGQADETGAYLCEGFGPHPDVHATADVVVRGKDGQTVVGLGKLGEGEDRGTLCDFRFEVDQVKAGEGFYTVTVGEQKPVQLSETDARNTFQTYYAH